MFKNRTKYLRYSEHISEIKQRLRKLLLVNTILQSKAEQCYQGARAACLLYIPH